MIKIMPSIDISNGKAVKRVKGVRGSGIIVGNPVKVAENLYNEGYEAIHIVDLDAAEGLGNNIDVINDITNIGFKWVQVGGGVRNTVRALELLRCRVSAVVISSIFFKNANIFREIVNSVGSDKIILALDYRSDGYVYISGWNEKSIKLEKAIELASQYSLLGILFTYIDSEGTMSGIDRGIGGYASKVKGLKEYAGGVSVYDDILFLDSLGFDYVIIGMALFKGILKGVKNV